MAEIDDIFASKGIPKAVIPIYSASVPPEPKKAANKKRKRVTQLALQPDIRPAPEVVIDSSEPVVHAKRPKIGKAGRDSSVKSPVSTSKKTDHDTESKFQDSRGSESRRKTEEGWAIYKEDELGIDDKGGDTPLCPFDCECCF